MLIRFFFLFWLGAFLVPPLPSNARETFTLKFPSDRAIGTVNFTAPDGQLKRQSAKGNVQALRDSVILLVDYATASNNLGALRKLAPNDLHTISFRKLEIDDDGLKNISHLTSLQDLLLEQTDVSDKGLAHLTPLKILYHISLRATLVTAKGFAQLKQIQNLADLDVSSNNLRDDGFKDLEAMKNLTILNVARTNISNTALVSIGKLPKLTRLNLEFNKGITDAGIASLTGLKNLTYLGVGDTSVTIACAKYLKLLPKLASLTVTETQFSPSDLAYLRTALPKCRVEERLKARGERWQVDVFDQSR